jgi:ethanolamine ammonia-lyase small subunit
MNEPKPALTPTNAPIAEADRWLELRQHTPARIALGRVGTSLPMTEVLRFAGAHAQARDAVHVPLDVDALAESLCGDGWRPLRVSSRAPTREAYLRRPDWGRRLSEASAASLQEYTAGGDFIVPDVGIVVADGLSALATQRHASLLLRALARQLQDLKLTIVIASLSRVALADEVGQILRARASLILLGERPGLTSPDSLGAYLTFAPKVGCTDAARNCVSNIRPEGLAFDVAAKRIAWLLREALRRQLTGVSLKDESDSRLVDADELR